MSKHKIIYQCIALMLGGVLLLRLTGMAASSSVTLFEESNVVRKSKKNISEISSVDTKLSDEEFAANGSIFTSEHTLPQKVNVKYDTKSDYIKVAQFEGEIHNIIEYEDEDMNSGVYYHVDDKVYKLWKNDFGEFDNHEDYLKTIETTLIAEDCKKMGFDDDNLFVLTNSGDVRLWGSIGKVKNCIFGDKSEYNGETVLGNVDDFWLNECYLAYVQDNNLYVLYQSYKTKDRVLVEKDCGKIISFYSIDPFDEIDSWLYVKEDNQLYGVGYNFNCIISEKHSSNKTFNKPRKIDIPIKVKQIYIDGWGAFAESTDNKIYFWGHILSRIFWDDLPDGASYKKYKDLINSKKYRSSVVNASKPLLVADNLKRICFTEWDAYGINDKDQSVRYRVEDIYDWEDKCYKTKVTSVVRAENIATVYDGGAVDLENNLLIKGFYCDLPDQYTDNVARVNNKHVKYNLRYPNFYAAEPYLVSENVSDLRNNKYMRDNTWFAFTQEGVETALYPSFADGAELLWTDNEMHIWLDKEGGLWYKNNRTPSKVYFAYSEEGRKCDNVPRKIEENVEKAWVDDEGIAMVKDSALYSYGLMERCAWKEPDVKHPPYLVKYKGIDANKVRHVSFTKKYMFITMKSGRVYKIVPKQGVRVGFYQDVRKVTKKQMLPYKNVKLYTNKYMINKKGAASIKTKTKDDKTKIIKAKNVAKVVEMNGTDGYTYLVLKKNGQLYGWGDNSFNALSSSKKKTFNFKNKVLIAENVKDMAMPEVTHILKSTTTDLSWPKAEKYYFSDAVYYLTNDDKLYFRGYNGHAFWNAKRFEK